MQDVALQASQFAAWLADTDIGLLELRTPHGSLRLGRQGDDIVVLPAYDAQEAAAVEPAVVRAPSVGVFLHGHPLAGAPLARIGEHVPAGQTVGLLQIGPLFLPVVTAEAGEIAAMCVGHGLPVGYGTPLVELLHPL
jgi:acetyl-CoA carboxylase biotin carboxyl carrier protein